MTCLLYTSVEAVNDAPMGESLGTNSKMCIRDRIEAAFKEARTVKGCPTAIIAKTLKGKGCLLYTSAFCFSDIWYYTDIKG